MKGAVNRDGRPDVVVRRSDGIALVEFLANTQWLSQALLYNMDPVWQQGAATESLQKALAVARGVPGPRAAPPGFTLPQIQLTPPSAQLLPVLRPMAPIQMPSPADRTIPIPPVPVPMPPGNGIRGKSTGNWDVFGIYYVHTDHLNTPRLLTRPSDGKAVWKWDNVDPFGANAPDENPSGFGAFTYNLRFPGQYFDQETGTHYNYFRDYDPSIGRYVESDPIGLRGGINTYAYVEGNPLSLIDFNGNEVGRDRDGSRDRNRPDPRPPNPDFKPQPSKPGKPGDPNCMGNCMKEKLKDCPFAVVASCAPLCLLAAGTGPGALGCAIGCSCTFGMTCYQLTRLQCSGQCDPQPGPRQ